MYPTIHSYGDAAGGTQNPLHAPYPSTSGPPAAAAPGPSSPPRTNGPPAGAPAQPAFPTLQVAIDPKFALGPPVRCGAVGQPQVLQPRCCRAMGAVCVLHPLPTCQAAETYCRRPFTALQVQAPPQPPGAGGQASGAGGAAPPPPPGHPAPGSKEPLDLSLEKKLVEQAASSSGAGGSGSNGQETGPQVGGGAGRWDRYGCALMCIHSLSPSSTVTPATLPA